MKFNNYDDVRRLLGRPRAERAPAADSAPRVHKRAGRAATPEVSIILLDWSVRDRFHCLDWLGRQDSPRDSYEIIWIELYDRVVPEALAGADTVITCGQRGLYRKHEGYNLGLLEARGSLLTISDSDAVYPPDFVTSIRRAFRAEDSARPLVLMHHQRRTSAGYPDGLDDLSILADKRWMWWPLVPNAGACMTVRREDALRFGGFDEHPSFRGYVCGPYDLGWRLVNAGIPEEWHDETTVIWHFAHPDPVGANGMLPPIGLLREHKGAHVDLHALTAVDAFSTGRILPLRENPEIWRRRMADRRIGTDFEARYASMTGPAGFSRAQVARLRFGLARMIVAHIAYRGLLAAARAVLRPLLGRRGMAWLRRRLPGAGARRPGPDEPEIVEVRNAFNIVRFRGRLYALPQSLGPVDVHAPEQMADPAILKADTVEELRRLTERKAGGR